jgi:hypothetical protein
MKLIQKIYLGIGLGLAVLTGPSAMGANYDDFDQFAVKISALNPIYVNAFQINADDGDGLGTVGFDSSVETVISAVADFTFRDNDGAESKVTIHLGGEVFGLNKNVGLNQTDIDGSTVNLVLTLNNNNGVVGYTISYGSGDEFMFIGASLTVETAPKVNVPDGGMTLALLGGSLIGLAGIRRRMAASRA